MCDWINQCIIFFQEICCASSSSKSLAFATILNFYAQEVLPCFYSGVHFSGWHFRVSNLNLKITSFLVQSSPASSTSLASHSVNLVVLNVNRRLSEFEYSHSEEVVGCGDLDLGSSLGVELVSGAADGN